MMIFPLLSVPLLLFFSTIMAFMILLEWGLWTWKRVYTMLACAVIALMLGMLWSYSGLSIGDLIELEELPPEGDLLENLLETVIGFILLLLSVGFLFGTVDPGSSISELSESEKELIVLKGQEAHPVEGIEDTKKEPLDSAAHEEPESREKKEKWRVKEKRKLLRFIMASIMASIVLLASLYVILSETYDDATQKWAFASIGLILGYFLNR